METCPSAEPEVNDPEDVDDNWQARNHSEVASFQVQTASSQKEQAQSKASLWNVNKVKNFLMIGSCITYNGQLLQANLFIFPFILIFCKPHTINAKNSLWN